MIYRILQTLLAGLCFVFCAPFNAVANPADGPFTASNHPFSFLENTGQITDQYGGSRADIDFKISSHGVNTFIGSGGIHYQWAKPVDAEILQTTTRDMDPYGAAMHQATQTWDMYRMDVTLIGADKNAPLIKESKLDYYERYYLPQCGPEGTTAYSYEKLTYKNVYPNIDWVLYVQDGHMKYDFVVHPGGKVSDIRLRYGGATSLKPDQAGGIMATTPLGTLTEKAPVSFQEDGKAVASRFVLADQTLGFAVGQYEGMLTIDPTLVWGTYYGGFASILEATFDVDYDKFHGDGVYICGMTQNTTNIATSGAYQVNFAGESDAFLAKFSSAGVRQWGTYYGGSMSEGQNSRIVCDTLGNIYVTGISQSNSNIATPGSHQSAFGGESDNFLVKFDASGARQWATYYGGRGLEAWPDLATDGLNVYMLSSTTSDTGIATTNSHQDMLHGNGSGSDVFLVKFNDAGVRQWATYYGGEGNEISSGGVVCDKFGFIYLTALTISDSGIATVGSYQDTRGSLLQDAFVVKFDSNGTRQWATYYGGGGGDEGNAIACDEFCNIYIAGRTESSSGIATSLGHQNSLGGEDDAFIVKFDSAGTRQWATYYGGAEDEKDLRVSYASGAVYLSGSSLSPTGIATVGGYQDTNKALGTIYGNVFLAEFNSDSGTRNWGTYYGGTGGEFAAGIANDDDGNVYIGGGTLSPSGIATPGSFNDTFKAILIEPYLAKFCLGASIANDLVINGPDSLCSNGNATYTIPEIEDVTTYIWTLPSGWSGNSDSNSIPIISGSTGGLISVQIVRCDDTSDMQTYAVYVFPPDPAIITVNGFVLGTVDTAYTSYQWLYNDTLIPGATGSTYTVTANGDYKVITTDHRGCVDTSEAYTVKNYTGIADQSLSKRIKLFPNPAKDLVTIQSPVPVTMVLSSMEGRILLKKLNAQSIDISNLAPGIYMLRILDRKGTLLKTEQLVKIAK